MRAVNNVHILGDHNLPFELVRHAGVDRNPEACVFGLARGALDAVPIAEFLGFIIISSPQGAGERWRRLGPKLRWGRQSKWPYPRQCPADRDRSRDINTRLGLWSIFVGGR